MRTTRIVALVLSAFATTAVLAGCSGGDEHSTMPGTSTSAAARADHNQADVTFARQMIPHHQQAVEMAKLVPSRTRNAQVVDLANRVQQAQDPEIRLMTGWLTAWAAPASMGHDGHGGMPGMMAPDAMTALGQARDADFDRRWLSMMIEHHQGAITMAEAELRDGSNAEAKQLAQRIIDAQRGEITTMNALLGTS
ncbi:DUF305 domain-containing protein [Amycolatopsis anabasis]|uniref:DUF305 domain-containing protein n=1 Tax=Amycolatopsis anabasis TaxID=1840409 RepID=UPI00131C0A0C|nr:DUF305 domain-containing protein [Amycolatopsis anabasis]